MNNKQKSMPYELDDILDDQRIQRLFSAKHSSSLQLWVLRIEGSDFTEERIVYGRLLPYSFNNNSWSFSDNDNSKSFENYKAQVKKLNLHLDGSTAKRVVEKLCSGETIRAISEMCGLRFGQSKISETFGDTKLYHDGLAFKPVVYLINKDAHPLSSIASPHGGAGALSASIVQGKKTELFTVRGNYNVDLTSMVIEQLNQDTGLKFGGHDLPRFGDIELLVFPTIDDQERSLKNIRWSDDRREVHISVSPAELNLYTRFQFHLRIVNNGQLLYSSLKMANQDNQGHYKCTFTVDSKLNSIADSMSLDIYRATDELTDEFTLFDRWTSHFVREMNFQLNVISNHSEFNQFDWLEKTVTPKLSDRVANVLSIKGNSPATRNNITTRQIDSWVPTNRSLSKIFQFIYPEKSEGAFFPRWGTSAGEGRLQFTEWFKKLAQSSQHHSITIFDPYFEDAGLALILLSSVPNSDYAIFRTNHQTDGASTTRGLETLLKACANNQKLLKKKKINIYGVSDGSLHDRYILVTGNKGIPVKGYHLSNSFQSAAENYPLLITPIPIDVLYKVVEYKNNLLSDSSEKVSHLYNSSSHQSELVKPNKDSALLDNDLMGDILSLWLHEPSLKGLKGSELKTELQDLNLYQDDFHHSVNPNGLKSLIEGTDFTEVNFKSYWNSIGELLAQTVSGSHDTDYFSSKTSFLDSLIGFLKTTFCREDDGLTSHELAVISPDYFKQTLSDLLHSSTAPHHFSIGVKQSLLTWGEYFCIKYLWAYDPISLVELVDIQAKKLNQKFDEKDKIRLSVLGQVLREISFSIELRQTSNLQMEAILNSNNDFLKWLAWCEIDNRVTSSNRFDLIKTLPSDEQYTFIGWSINRHSKTNQDAKLFDELIRELHKSFPDSIDLALLRSMIDSMRGHMKQLSWAEPWISRKVLSPLIDNHRVSFENASQIWHEEMVSLLEPSNSLGGSHLFDPSREGEITNIAAWLWSQSTSTHQNKCLKKLEQILMKQKQVIQQPLASTSNWSKWDDALQVSLWIWLFIEWCRYYNSSIKQNNSKKLLQLHETAKELALVRPESDWLPQNTDIHSKLFLTKNWLTEQLATLDLKEPN